MADDIQAIAGDADAAALPIVINLPPSVLVTAPNGGEVFQPGQAVQIRWDSFDADNGVLRHDVRFSADGGLTFSNIATGLFGEVQSFSWTVPASPTSQGRIEVIAYDVLGRSGRDRSNANFTIGGSAGASIAALQPATLRAGEATQLSVTGSGLALVAAAYQVVTAFGQALGGVQVVSASGTGSSISLLIDVAASTPAGNYQLRMQSPGGPVMAPLAITAVALQPALSVLPASQSVTAGGSVIADYALASASGTDYSISFAPAVPEPGSWQMLAAGLCLLGLLSAVCRASASPGSPACLSRAPRCSAGVRQAGPPPGLRLAAAAG